MKTTITLTLDELLNPVGQAELFHRVAGLDHSTLAVTLTGLQPMKSEYSPAGYPFEWRRTTVPYGPLWQKLPEGGATPGNVPWELSRFTSYASCKTVEAAQAEIDYAARRYLLAAEKVRNVAPPNPSYVVVLSRSGQPDVYLGQEIQVYVTESHASAVRWTFKEHAYDALLTFLARANKGDKGAKAVARTTTAMAAAAAEYDRISVVTSYVEYKYEHRGY